MAAITPLAKVGQVTVPAEALRHPFARECQRAINTLRSKNANVVVGTTNHIPRAQLYGWKPNVPSHADGTGWVYFVPLRLPADGSLVGAGAVHMALEVGGVYELNDRVNHYTYESRGTVLSLFLGPFKIRQRDRALAEISAGLTRLADAENWDAPRVTEGFRDGPLRGECWAWDYSSPYPVMVRRSELRAKGLHLIRCHCGKPAARLDGMFPYEQSQTACRSCRK